MSFLENQGNGLEYIPTSDNYFSIINVQLKEYNYTYVNIYVGFAYHAYLPKYLRYKIRYYLPMIRKELLHLWTFFIFLIKTPLIADRYKNHLKLGALGLSHTELNLNKISLILLKNSY